MGVVMADVVEEKKSGKNSSRLNWFWPFGVAVTSLAGIALVALRGCWHRHMSWPVRMQDHSYQVCLECGVKRLFDEKRFCSYGPFRYDLNELIAWQHGKRSGATPLPHQSVSGIAASKIS